MKPLLSLSLLFFSALHFFMIFLKARGWVHDSKKKLRVAAAATALPDAMQMNGKEKGRKKETGDSPQKLRLATKKEGKGVCGGKVEKYIYKTRKLAFVCESGLAEFGC